MGDPGDPRTLIDTPTDLPSVTTPFAWARQGSEPAPLSFEPQDISDYDPSLDTEGDLGDLLLAIFNGPANLSAPITLRAAQEIEYQPIVINDFDFAPAMVARTSDGVLLFSLGEPMFPEHDYAILALKLDPNGTMLVYAYDQGGWFGGGWIKLDMAGIEPPHAASPDDLKITTDLVLQTNGAPAGFWSTIVLEGEAKLPGLYHHADSDWVHVGPAQESRLTALERMDCGIRPLRDAQDLASATDGLYAVTINGWIPSAQPSLDPNNITSSTVYLKSAPGAVMPFSLSMGGSLSVSAATAAAVFAPDTVTSGASELVLMAVNSGVTYFFPYGSITVERINGGQTDCFNLEAGRWGQFQSGDPVQNNGTSLMAMLIPFSIAALDMPTIQQYAAELAAILGTAPGIVQLKPGIALLNAGMWKILCG